MESYKVVNYALSLNRYLWSRNDGVHVILHYAVWREAQKIAVREPDALRQIAYMYARDPDNLPDEITEHLEFLELGEAVKEVVDGSFNLQDAVDVLTEYGHNQPTFMGLSIDWYKFYVSFTGASKFYLSYNCDKYTRCKSYLKLFPEADNRVPASIPLAMLLEWQHKNSARDIALVAMYTAIRSIVGKKTITSTTRGFIFARMFGARNETELAQLCTNDAQIREAADEWNPATHRKKFTKLLDILRAKHLINYCGYGRRTYVSLSTDDDDLALAIAEAVQEKTGARSNVRQMVNKYLQGTP